MDLLFTKATNFYDFLEKAGYGGNHSGTEARAIANALGYTQESGKDFDPTSENINKLFEYIKSLDPNEVLSKLPTVQNVEAQRAGYPDYATWQADIASSAQKAENRLNDPYISNEDAEIGDTIDWSTGKVTKGASTTPFQSISYDHLVAANTANPPQYDSLGMLIPGTGGKPNGQGGPDGILTPGISSPASSATSSVPSTGVSELDAILGRMDQYLQDLQAQGKTINPNIELTPQEIQKFLDQATKEIEPYYSQQINLIKGDLTRSLSNLQKHYDLQKKNTEAQFKQNVSGLQEDAASSGTIFSGRRALDERNLQQATQRSLDSSALSLSEQAGDLARNAERTIGSRNLSGVLYPSLSTPTVSANGFGSRSLDYFNPSSDITGSLEREQMTAIQSRKNELEMAARGDRALNFYTV